MSETANQELNQQLQERFKTLPKVVQDAITSADVEKRMRALAETHKLHLDQWEALENEVMLALLGFQPVENLQKNIEKEVGVDTATAGSLAADISKIVFEPIRGALERGLEHPAAKPEEVSAVEAARTAVITAESQPAADPVQNQTPEQPKVVRTPVSESYKSGETSIARKDVHNDPYRESPV